MKPIWTALQAMQKAINNDPFLPSTIKREIFTIASIGWRVSPLPGAWA